MRKVVFITPPLSLEERYGHLAQAGNSMPALGVLFLAAAARSNGFRPHVIEASALGYGCDKVVEEIRRISPEYVGITSTTLSILSAAKVAGLVKGLDPSIRTILGGPHVTALPHETMERFPQFDIGVIGEGERTIVQLLEILEHHGDLNDANGIVFRRGGELTTTPPRPFIKDLDSLAFPAWDLLPNFPKAYRPPPFRVRRMPAASIVTSRGCPNRCTFCDRSVFGRMPRGHSAGYVIDMIKELYSRYGVRELLIEDDVFFMWKSRLLEICEGILKSGLIISWSCLGRVNKVSPEVLKIMRRAGCWQIGYGIESGDQGLLDLAQKGITLEEVKQALAWTREAGIQAKGFFILGFPGETRGSMERTRDFVKRVELDDISVSFMTPFPGSEIHDVAEKYGRFENDWSRMNLLNVVFVPDGLTEEDLEGYQRRILRDFYLRRRIVATYGKRVLQNPKIAESALRGVRAFLKTAFQDKDDRKRQKGSEVHKMCLESSKQKAEGDPDRGHK